MHFVFITGGVASSLGKGLASAALASLLQLRNFKIRIKKLDPYLNVDPGTMSPYQHGEVFVTDDGAETDLDLGHYERFTNQSAKKSDSISSGKIYRSGPFAKNHATAGTFFFRKQFLSMSSFRDSDRAGEEANFLKNYQTPMEQIRPEHTIICLAHSKNTISKKRFFKDDRLIGTLDDKKLPEEITSKLKELKKIL